MRPKLTTGRSPTGRDKAKADFRWGMTDPTVVSLEILTVLGAGLLCFYIINQLVGNVPRGTTGSSFLTTAKLHKG